MAIYGDGKHNENMEYNTSKFQVTDRVVYRTTNWTVESESDTYYVQCQEEDFGDAWYIRSEDNDDIDIHSELGQKLIEICEFDWEMDGDES